MSMQKPITSSILSSPHNVRARGLLLSNVFLFALVFGLATIGFPALADSDKLRLTALLDGVKPSQWAKVKVKNIRNPTNGENLSVVVRDIDEFMDLESDHERYEGIPSLTNIASKARLIELLNESKAITDSSLRVEVQEEIFARLGILDPTDAMDQLKHFSDEMRGGLVSAIFSGWKITDTEVAVANAKKLDEPFRRIALESILFMHEWGSKYELHAIAREIQASEVAADLGMRTDFRSTTPRLETSWNSLVSDEHNDKIQLGFMIEISRELVDSKGLEIVPDLVASIPNLSVRTIVLDSVLAFIAEKYPREAFEVAVGLYKDPIDEPLKNVVRSWSRQKPRDALSAVTKLESQELRNSLRRIVVANWALTKPRMVLLRLSQLPPELREWGEAHAIRRIADENPGRGAELIDRVDDSLWYQVAARMVSEWCKRNQHEDAAKWLDAQGNKSVRQFRMDSLWTTVLKDLVYAEPRLAMNMARQLPPDRNELGLEVKLIQHLALTDIGLATEMMSLVRDGDSKVAASCEIGNLLLRNDRINDTHRLTNEFSEPMRSEFYTCISKQMAKYQPTRLYKLLDEFPSQDFRVRAARALVNASGSRKTLASDELEYVRSVLANVET